MAKPRNSVSRWAAGLAMLGALTGCVGIQPQESTGQYVDDSVITTKVKGAIFNEPALKSLQINVKTFKGVVQLSGFVDSQRSASRAGEVARGVGNVASVENDLIVK